MAKKAEYEEYKNTEETPEERQVVINITPKKFKWAVGGSLFLLTIIIALFFIFTPILSKLKLPVYGGYISSSLLIERMQKLDSLEFEVALWRYYNKNIKDVIDGNSPTINTDSIRLSLTKVSDSEIKKIYADTLLRQKVYSDRAFESSKQIHSYNLFPPINGSISKRFNAEAGQYGMEIRVNTLTPVLATNDGTIIASYWSSATGNTISIQHSDNMISIYSMLSQTNRTVGNYISAGEVIGYVGGEIADTKITTNHNADSFKLIFELWHNGNRVDPENYILF